MKSVLLTGKNGQVGWELERTLAPIGQIFAFDHGALDLADSNRIRSAVREIRPDIVVNAAAYTAVDQAESEPEVAMAVNGVAPGVLAEETKRLGALLVHYSTDYVFDGAKPAPYTEDDAPNPINAYGRSKLAGERAIQSIGCRHLILRTSWVYGLRGQNFLRTICRLADERSELRVVNDQIGAPTWSRMIAEVTSVLLHSEPPAGLYHLTSAGSTNWHEFARAILDARGWQGRLQPIHTGDYPLPAKRPENSRLDCTRLFRDTGILLPFWQSMLALALRDSNLLP